MRKKTAYKLLLIKSLMEIEKPYLQVNYLLNMKNKLINFLYFIYNKIF